MNYMNAFLVKSPQNMCYLEPKSQIIAIYLRISTKRSIFSDLYDNAYPAIVRKILYYKIAF